MREFSTEKDLHKLKNTTLEQAEDLIDPYFDEPLDFDPDAEYDIEYKQDFDSVKSIDQIEVEPNVLYEWYKNAIERRGREPLEEDRFHRHFFEGASMDQPVFYGNPSDGYLLGIFKHNLFIPTHFAPKTLRGGYNLFKNLGEGEGVASVVSVTDDLAETLNKMSCWKSFNIKIPAKFREENNLKTLMYNSNPDTQNNLMSLATELIQEYKERMYDHDENQE